MHPPYTLLTRMVKELTTRNQTTETTMIQTQSSRRALDVQCVGASFLFQKESSTITHAWHRPEAKDKDEDGAAKERRDIDGRRCTTSTGDKWYSCAAATCRRHLLYHTGKASNTLHASTTRARNGCALAAPVTPMASTTRERRDRRSARAHQRTMTLQAMACSMASEGVMAMDGSCGWDRGEHQGGEGASLVAAMVWNLSWLRLGGVRRPPGSRKRRHGQQGWRRA